MISCDSARAGIDRPLASFKQTKNPSRNLFWSHTGRAALSDSERLFQIERFVDEVISSEKFPVESHEARGGVIKPKVTRLYHSLIRNLQSLWFFDSFHDYSEKPYVFLHTCWLAQEMFGLNLPRFAGRCSEGDLTEAAPYLNWIVQRIRDLSHESWFAACRYYRRSESKRRAARIVDVASSILQMRSKVVFVRVDFGYKAEVRPHVGIDDLLSDRERLYALRHSHAVFKHLLGYVWVIEEGKDKAVHCHNLFMFDGAKVRADVLIGNLIRGLWEADITSGRGDCWNSNAKRLEKQLHGLGMISRSDDIACKNAIYFATYLGKDHHRDGDRDDQHVRMRPRGARIFGTSQEDFSEVRPGRPPTKPMTWHRNEVIGFRWPNEPVGFTPTRARPSEPRMRL